MAKHKQPDRLSQDASAALAAGMSYGKYMAAKEPVKVTMPARSGIWRTCPYCGKEFVRYDKMRQIYCGFRCQRAAQDAREYERRKALRGG